MNKKDKVNELSTETSLNNVSNSKLNEIVNVNKSLEEVEKQEHELDNYLHSNIFNFVEAKEGLENIFEIQNNALKIVDELDRHGLNLDRTVPLLEVRNLTKSYPSQKVPTVVNASFKVYPGDFHVLVGANGSGKTTLLKCLLKETEFEGEVLVGNKKNNGEDQSWKKLVGVVDERSSWDPEKTVHDLIVETAKNLGKSELEAVSYARSSLEQLDIWGLRFRKVIQLGLLESRKVGLALALINDPHLVVLDEPLTGLQSHEQVEVLVLLAKLQKQNRGVLVLSYLINEFSNYANMITILSRGRVFYSGLIQNLELYNQYKFTVNTTDNQAALSLLKNINSKYRYNDLSKTILVKFDGKLNLLLFQKECASKNIVINDLRHAATSLEDLYSVLLKVGTAEAIKEIYDYRLANRKQD